MTIWRMRIACWVTKAKNTHHTQVVSYSLSSHYNNGCTNALQYDVIRTVRRLSCSVATELKGSKQKIWDESGVGGGGGKCVYVKNWFKPIFPLFLTRLVLEVPNINGRFYTPFPHYC